MLQAKIIKKDGLYYLEQYDNAVLMQTLPTLPEHSAYWKTMEGKVFGEEVFHIGDNKNMPCIDCGKSCVFWHSHCCTSIEPSYEKCAIPKQQEQDLWEVAFENAYTYAANKEQIDFEDRGVAHSKYLDYLEEYLKQHYTLAKKH